MASTYLDKFRSGLRAIQSRQILTLLTREKNKGAISSVEEFKSRLADLTSKLNSTTIAPTLQLFMAEIGDRIDSESFNFMLGRIEDDLVAAFQEANTIDEVIDAHETIINDVVLKNLELAINDLESKIDSLEFINKTSVGFDDAIFNTFRVTQNNRTSVDQGVVFTDPKTLIESGPGSEAFIDFIGEKLLLHTSLNKDNRIAGIRQIFDAEARQSELKVEFTNSNLNNIIDQRVGSFWIQSVLQSQPQTEAGILTKLELDLGSVQTINFLQLEPIILYPIDLYRISYLDENNQVKTILSNPIEIKSTNRLFFNTISVRKLIVTFRNRNYSQTQFEVKADSPLVSIVRDPLNSSLLIEAVKPDLQELVSNPRLKEILGLNTEGVSDRRKYYEYLIGFDNIKVGLNEFDENAIFISKTEKVNNCGQAAIKVLDRRPFSDTVDNVVIEYTEDTQPVGLDTYFHGSIEYYLIKRDYSSTDALLNTFYISVLPLNTSNIRHERLLLNKKSSPSLTTNDIGTLQFFTLNGFADVHVYRNGEELASFDLDPLETDGWEKDTANSVSDPGGEKRMSYSIRIQQPNPGDIYTVSYTPARSTSDIIPQDLSANPAVLMVDLSGFLDAWLGKNNVIYFADKKKGSQIAHSLLNLVIVLRRNSSNVTLTPVVEEYLLATGTKNNTKFGDSR